MSDETIPSPRTRAAQATVPIWALAFISILFLVTCVSLWAFIAITRPTVPAPTSSAVFVVIQGPTSTVTFDPLLATLGVPTDTPAADATPTIPPLINGGVINLGSFVQVANTDGDPLNLRSAPSLTGERVYLALAGEVFKVENGPTIAEGFTWWYLVDPIDGTKSGWAVENYLAVTTNP
jgi:hypothetical protein